MIEVRVTRVRPMAKIPEYMSDGAAGCDVCACLNGPHVLLPLQRSKLPTGISVEIPNGYELQVRPRSGLAIHKGLTLVNSPGTVDSDYRGEIQVLVINLGTEPVTIEPGDRIAQLVLKKVEKIHWAEVERLTISNRGSGGFGSTDNSAG